MNAWSHLPNAKHIDRVLTSFEVHPKVWGAAKDAARGAAKDAARGEARDAARDAALALIAYDHCEKYLSMSPDELFIWWKLSDDPACLLLMPMIKVLQMEIA